MLQYPDPLRDYPLSWVKSLAGIKEKNDVIRLEKKDIRGLVKDPDLQQFYSRIEELSRLGQLPELPPMEEDRYTFLYTIPKKQHEIRKLGPFVHHVAKNSGTKKIIDIGGGIGKLAQTLNSQYNLHMISVDMDPVLQDTGKRRQEKKGKPAPNEVEYVTAKVDEADLTFQGLLDENTMTLGLHTCGALANHQIMTSSRHSVRSIINFGCCYHKLEHEMNGQNISTFAQNHSDKIVLGHFSLALSARAHRKMDSKDYDLKQKVKYFRYAIHMLLHDFYGEKELVTLGNSNPALYDEDFGTYALEQLKRTPHQSIHTREELNAWFNDKARQELLWDMIASGLIRNSFGRLLELYLLLDRAIYLEEQGYLVNLQEFFIEEISPRNIGLIATR